MLIHQFITGLTEHHQTNTQWILIAMIGVSIGLIGYFSGLIMQHYFHQNLKLSQKVNSIINSKLFDHSMALNHGARQRISIGDVVNHMSSDSESVADLSFVLIELVIDVLLILATLLKAKIIILDEATASVDIKTDQAIQHILDHELQGVTLLIIAHRLETLKNTHQIIQLSRGRVVNLDLGIRAYSEMVKTD